MDPGPVRHGGGCVDADGQFESDGQGVQRRNAALGASLDDRGQGTLGSGGGGEGGASGI